MNSEEIQENQPVIDSKMIEKGQYLLEECIKWKGFDHHIKEVVVSYEEAGKRKEITKVANVKENEYLIKVLTALNEILSNRKGFDDFMIAASLSLDDDKLLELSLTSDERNAYIARAALLTKKARTLAPELQIKGVVILRIREIR